MTSFLDAGTMLPREYKARLDPLNVPMHHVLRIDEVEKEGTGKIRKNFADAR
jgi:hypothetical protein